MEDYLKDFLSEQENELLTNMKCDVNSVAKVIGNAEIPPIIKKLHPQLTSEYYDLL